MKLSHFCRAFVCAVFPLLALAGSARADVTLHEISPEDGTTGTALQVVLSGELGKGKPKLWLQLSGDATQKPKKTPLKVGALVPEDGIEGAFRLDAGFKNTKTGDGLHDLHVKRKGKGLGDLVFEEVFTIRAPEIDSVTPDTASPKDLITVSGDFFGGPKKPVVFLAGTGKPKKAKVIGKPTVVEGKDTLLARVPKLPGGSHSVIVTSKAGAGVAANVLEVIAPVPGGSKKKLSLLHVFNGEGDGSQVHSRLLLAPDGMFYGTAWTGGSADAGTIFRISPTGTFTLLRDMTPATDGSRSQKGLILGPDGALYGAAQLAGPLSNGTIFRITTDGDFSILHSFSPVTDGGGPAARLLLASDGNLYGTTIAGGGGTAASGTAFRLTPAGEFTKLFVFRSTGVDSEFGYMVTSALVEGPDGKLYGVASLGGNGCGTCGTIFRLTKDGEPELLHTFTGPDGSGPSGPLLLASDGLLYGVTGLGGTGTNGGTVFRISTTGVFESLHSVTAQDNSVSVPSGSLVQTPNGNLYGTANVVFRLTPAGQFSPVYTTLDLIKEFGTGPAPILPRGGMVVGPDGALYGTSLGSTGPTNHGTVFRVKLD